MPSGFSSLSRTPLLLVERLADVALEIGEAIAGDRFAGRLAQLGAERPPGGDRKDLGLAAKQRPCMFGDEDAHLFAFLRPLEHVDLVDHDDDLLAPVLDVLQERPLALGERPVGRGDEQHEVGLRHELAGEPFVLAKDGVGARRIDDVDVPQERHGRGDDVRA